MESPQRATLFFFAPLFAAYLAPCALWLAIDRLRPGLWPKTPASKSARPRLDLALAFAAIVGLLALGQVYRAGFLLPTDGDSIASRLAWVADNFIIYSPIFIVLAARRQKLDTAFLSRERLLLKIGAGLAAALSSVAIYLALRGELAEMPSILAGAATAKRAADFVPVFLEGVALAFLLVRLEWSFGTTISSLVPSLLFAAAHVPSQIAESRSIGEVIVFFVANTALVTVVLRVLLRSRDIVWLGLVHYAMDLAIRAI